MSSIVGLVCGLTILFVVLLLGATCLYIRLRELHRTQLAAEAAGAGKAVALGFFAGGGSAPGGEEAGLYHEDGGAGVENAEEEVAASPSGRRRIPTSQL